MRVTVYIPDNLGIRLKQADHNEGMSVSIFIAKAVEEYLKQTRKEPASARLLELIRPGSGAPDAWEEIERQRVDDRT
jgi:metal-responsive CopG/Arc/MetJ family transcriptional regulator